MTFSSLLRLYLSFAGSGHQTALLNASKVLRARRQALMTPSTSSFRASDRERIAGFAAITVSRTWSSFACRVRGWVMSQVGRTRGLSGRKVTEDAVACFLQDLLPAVLASPDAASHGGVGDGPD